MLKVTPVMDGGNPRNAHDIVQNGTEFTIYPFSEDGDMNYKFHMCVQLENSTGTPQCTTFVIDWGDDIYNACRNLLLICTDEDNWTRTDGTVDGTKVTVTCDVPPGVSYLALHPRYEHGRLERLVASLPKDRFNVHSIGKSRMGRDIWAIEHGSSPHRPVVLYSRVHPYESASSYMLEGMIKALVNDNDYLQGRRVVLIPMPNPDGVAEGTNKMTMGGLDMERFVRHSKEPEAVAFKNYVMGLNPKLVFDIHSWNNKWDGMETNDPQVGRVVYDAIMADKKVFNTPVSMSYRLYNTPGDGGYNYISSELGTSYIVSSWVHYNRTGKDLYQFGAALMKASVAGTGLHPAISVLPALDAGNPRNASDIVKRENDFLIHPFSEDSDGNYKFHMNVAVENKSDKPQRVNFTVEWGDEVYQTDRDYLILCTSDDEWTYLNDIKVEGSRTSGSAVVPSGLSHLCLHPRYEHGRLLRLVKKLPFEVKSIGKTRKQRDIIAIEAGDRAKRTIAFYARVHPYETIGNYFVEGILNWLAEGGSGAKELLANNHFVFVPMPNTDGVIEGTQKYTLGGLNFSVNFRQSSEPEAMALKNYFAETKPSIIFDLHAWNNPWDNIASNDGEIAKAIYKAVLDENKLFTRPLDIRHNAVAWANKNHSCSYFTDELGVAFVNSSWYHRGKTAKELYAMGVVLLKAVGFETKTQRITKWK